MSIERQNTLYLLDMMKADFIETKFSCQMATDYSPVAAAAKVHSHVVYVQHLLKGTLDLSSNIIKEFDDMISLYGNISSHYVLICQLQTDIIRIRCLIEEYTNES